MHTYTGRVTGNATVRTVLVNGKNKQVVNFTIAENERILTKNGTKELTAYYQCSYWLAAGVAEHLSKGLLVAVTGRISASAWIKDGKPVGTLQLKANKIDFLAKPQPKNNALTTPHNSDAAEPQSYLPF